MELGMIYPMLSNVSSPTAYNRAYLASLHFAQIPLRETSDTLGTLYEIVPPPKKEYLKIQGDLL